MLLCDTIGLGSKHIGRFYIFLGQYVYYLNLEFSNHTARRNLMQKQFDIAPRRKRAGITQKEFEQEIGWPIASMGAIEDGRIGIDEDTYQAIHTTLDRMERKRKEAAPCDESVLAAASGGISRAS